MYILCQYNKTVEDVMEDLGDLQKLYTYKVRNMFQDS